MNKDQDKDQRHGEAQAHQRPGDLARPRMQLQQHQSGDAEDHAADGEDVEEQTPGRPGVATLVQVVEVGDRAAAGALVDDCAVAGVEGHPAVAARAGQRDVGFRVRPLDGGGLGRLDAHFLGQPGPDRIGQGALLGLCRLGDAQQVGGKLALGLSIP